MTKQEVLRDVDKTSIQLILKEPFYGHFFSNLIRECVDGEHPVQTAAVSLTSNNVLSLLVNKTFWNEKLNVSNILEAENYKYGIVKHEILHILFKHIFQYNKFSNKQIANIAVDLVVNQCIKEEQLPMKDEICLLKNFPDFFPDIQSGGKDCHQTSEYYYNKLIKESDKIRNILNEGLEGQDQQSSSNSGSGGQQQNSSGSNQQDQQDQQDQQKQEEQEEKQNNQQGSNNPNWDKLNKSQKNLAKFLQNENNQKMHSTWDKLSKLKQGKKEFVEKWVDNTVQETVKKCDRSTCKNSWRGKLPGELLDYIDELIAKLKPSVNWKRQLRKFAANGEKTYLVPTLKRRSKRYGTFPGHKIKKESRIMVAIDTSGSVDNASLAEFFSEIHHIYKADAEIRIVECDYNIGNVWDYTGTPPDKISGRGGTSFDEPIIYANTEYNPDCVIYFTDGEAPPPPKCKCPLMWIISKNQGVEVEDMKDFQGIKVKMNF
jgi:predicted metal-dependent peptidase